MIINRRYDLQDGTVALSQQVDDEFDQILDLVNGKLASDNIAASSITKDRLSFYVSEYWQDPVPDMAALNALTPNNGDVRLVVDVQQVFIYDESILKWRLFLSTVDHNELEGREEADAHPILAITGLRAELDAHQGKLDDHEARMDVIEAKNLPAIDPTNIGHNKILTYNATTQKMEYISNPVEVRDDITAGDSTYSSNKIENLLTTKAEVAHTHQMVQITGLSDELNDREKKIHRGPTSPNDTTRIWFDTSVEPNVQKYFNGISWVTFAGGTGGGSGGSGASQFSQLTDLDSTNKGPDKIIKVAANGLTHTYVPDDAARIDDATASTTKTYSSTKINTELGKKADTTALHSHTNKAALDKITHSGSQNIDLNTVSIQGHTHNYASIINESTGKTINQDLAGKQVIFLKQSATPDAPTDTNQIWINTTFNPNRLYYWNGTAWTTFAGQTAGATALSNMSDVNATNKAIGRILEVDSDGVSHKYVDKPVTPPGFDAQQFATSLSANHVFAAANAWERLLLNGYSVPAAGPSGGETSITYNTTLKEFNIAEAGYYTINAGVMFSAATGYTVQASIFVNDIDTHRIIYEVSTVAVQTGSTSVVVKLAAGDKVCVKAQTSNTAAVVDKTAAGTYVRITRMPKGTSPTGTMINDGSVNSLVETWSVNKMVTELSLKASAANEHTHSNKTILDKITQTGAESSIDLSALTLKSYTDTELAKKQNKFVQANTAPADTTVIWIDSNSSPYTQKYHDGTNWVAFAGGSGGGSGASQFSQLTDLDSTGKSAGKIIEVGPNGTTHRYVDKQVGADAKQLYARCAATFSFTAANTWYKVPMPNSSLNELSLSYVGEDWAISETGMYEVNASLLFQNAATANLIAAIYVNGGEYHRIISETADSYYQLGSTSSMMKLNAGDKISVYAQSSVTAAQIAAGPGYTYLKITKMPTGGTAVTDSYDVTLAPGAKKQMPDVAFDKVVSAWNQYNDAFTGSDIVPTLSSSTGGGFTVTASSQYNSTNVPYRAFDGTATDWSSAASEPNGWIKIQVPAGTQPIRGYAIDVAEGNVQYLPTEFAFQGSNDDVNWTTLDYKVGYPNASFTAGLNRFFFNNSTSFTYYRWQQIANGGAPKTTIYEMELYTSRPGVRFRADSELDVYYDYDAKEYVVENKGTLTKTVRIVKK